MGALLWKRIWMFWLREEEKKAKTNKNSNNYETPNILNGKKHKNIKKILNNIDKNIGKLFYKKKFTVIKLVYLIN